MFAFLGDHAKLTDKPGEGPFARSFVEGDDNSISFCIENESGAFKSVLYLKFDDSDTVREAYFSKGDPLNFDNWSPIQNPDATPFDLDNETQAGKAENVASEWPLSGIMVSCCEVVFAMKAMLNISGIRRTLAGANQEAISEVS